MDCLKCNGTKFSNVNVRFTPEVKGEVVEVILPATACTQCGETLMDSTQMNELRRAAADEYRSKHGLLKSREIIKLREKLGMSQIEFARYLAVGEASIKRWETYYPQEEGQDQHIRIKCDEAAAEVNLLDIHWKSSPADIFSGMRKFNFEAYKAALIALLKHCKTPLMLNKALFYADFLHFKHFGISLTGSRYVPMEYGPCPDRYSSMIKLLLDKNIIKKKGKHELVASAKAEYAFDDREQQTIDTIIEHVKKDGGEKLLKKSHEEAAFKETPYLDFIKYTHAKTLKI